MADEQRFKRQKIMFKRRIERRQCQTPAQDRLDKLMNELREQAEIQEMQEKVAMKEKAAMEEKKAESKINEAMKKMPFYHTYEPLRLPHFRKNRNLSLCQQFSALTISTAPVRMLNNKKTILGLHDCEELQN